MQNEEEKLYDAFFAGIRHGWSDKSSDLEAIKEAFIKWKEIYFEILNLQKNESRTDWKPESLSHRPGA